MYNSSDSKNSSCIEYSMQLESLGPSLAPLSCPPPSGPMVHTAGHRSAGEVPVRRHRSLPQPVCQSNDASRHLQRPQASTASFFLKLHVFMFKAVAQRVSKSLEKNGRVPNFCAMGGVLLKQQNHRKKFCRAQVQQVSISAEQTDRPQPPQCFQDPLRAPGPCHLGLVP